MKSTVTIKPIIAVLIVCFVTGIVRGRALADEEPRNLAVPLVERTALFPGFDGKLCKVQPTVTTDGKGTMFLTYQKLLLTGSDVFYGQFISRSDDMGKTWSEPRELTALKDTWERGYRVAHYATPLYLVQKHRWVALGTADLFKDDREPYQVYENGESYGWPLMVDMDPVRGTYTGYRKLDFPFQYEFAMPFGQTLELEDGDVLIPFYFRPVGGGKRGRCVIVRYRFDGKDLKVVRAGTPVVRDDLARGVGEPSLIRHGGKIYMTLRSDEMGMWCASDVPERGARLGNFFVSHTGDEAYLVTAEWMQPRGCEKHGSDNSLWLLKFSPKGSPIAASESAVSTRCRRLRRCWSSVRKRAI